MTTEAWVTEPASLRDRTFLDRAVGLGRRGWARVHPNPMVGCVLVRGDEVVGEGWHAEYGGPHAEVVALQAAGKRAEGAEAFVSLEPCRHQGKTPPCVNALVETGVRRVVFGAADPGEASGGGGTALREAGIEVVGPVLTRREARWENPFFFHDDPDRPWVALKLATSLDGAIAERPGVRTQLTGVEAARETHRLRAGFDAILVGNRTARIDDPLLTVRGETQPRLPPRRIVLDEEGSLSPEARVFQVDGGEAWVLTTEAASSSWRTAIEATGARVLPVAASPSGTVDLEAGLRRLRSEGIASLLCEGGAELGASLLEGGQVDRLYLVVAPRLLGPEGVRAFPGVGARAGVANAPGGPWSLGQPPILLGADVWFALEPNAREGEG